MDLIAKSLRIRCLELAHLCKDGNLQSAFSSVDIIRVLYESVLKGECRGSRYLLSDSFIISKGQATLALYAVLVRHAILSRDAFDDIGQFHANFSNQVDVTKLNGEIDNSAGSLGHGFPYAVGMAMANKIKGSPSHIYVLAGDGEFNEGTMWESCLVAASKKLDNLCVIVDDNHSAGAMIDMGSLADKLLSFGFYVSVVDGHDSSSLKSALLPKPYLGGRPRAIIAHTQRGYGSPTLQSDPIWFHKYPNEEELQSMIKEIQDL